MKDIENNKQYNEQYNEYQDEVLQLQLYPHNQTFRVEMCKLFCVFITTSMSIGFIITAAMRQCIYNCKS
tara:strand:- start:4817 stop:5023 length:207 start_codon:yes stop_codon:yes gene_type:complete